MKPFIKRQKNDAADAEAICEAAQRPAMRFVPVKSAEQQASGVVFRACDLLICQSMDNVFDLSGIAIRSPDDVHFLGAELCGTSIRGYLAQISEELCRGLNVDRVRASLRRSGC